jgi:hypothetical protein
MKIHTEGNVVLEGSITAAIEKSTDKTVDLRVVDAPKDSNARPHRLARKL